MAIRRENVAMPRKNNSELAYSSISEAGKFREQFRFAFSGVVIATVFVVPSENVFELLLKGVLGFSAFFAFMYLIVSAANIKYREPGVMYQMLYVGERFRMRMYDFSVDTFAVAFLYLLGLVSVGIFQSISGVKLAPLWQWSILIVVMLALAVTILFISMAIKKRELATKKKLPLI